MRICPGKYEHVSCRFDDDGNFTHVRPRNPVVSGKFHGTEDRVIVNFVREIDPGSELDKHKARTQCACFASESDIRVD